MELEQARKRAEELRVIIEKNNRLYYDQDAPELEDFEYDALNRELKQIEAEYPELVTASSPTQHVGGTASSKFSKVTHAVKMESRSRLTSCGSLTPACGRQASGPSTSLRPKSTACLSALSTAWASWCEARPAATVSSARM